MVVQHFRDCHFRSASIVLDAETNSTLGAKSELYFHSLAFLFKGEKTFGHITLHVYSKPNCVIILVWNEQHAVNHYCEAKQLHDQA